MHLISTLWKTDDFSGGEVVSAGNNLLGKLFCTARSVGGCELYVNHVHIVHEFLVLGANCVKAIAQLPFTNKAFKRGTDQSVFET